MNKEIAGNTVKVDEEGYLTDPSQWNETVAAALAVEEGIPTLTDRHLAVLNHLRQQQSAGVPLTIRALGKSGVVTIKELYELFPGGPLKKASKIAGIPKPTGCI